MKDKEIKIITLAQLIGKMVSYTIAVEYGWTHIKLLEKALLDSLIQNNGSYEGKTFLPD